MTTYEDVIKTKKEMEKATELYKLSYAEYFLDILRTLGFYDKVVYCEKLKMRGTIKIVSTGFSLRPFKFAFFPLKKDGTLSQNSRYVRECFSMFCFLDPLKKSRYEQILEALEENFSVIKEEIKCLN